MKLYLAKEWMTGMEQTHQLALDPAEWQTRFQLDFVNVTDDKMCHALRSDPHTAVVMAVPEKLGYTFLVRLSVGKIIPMVILANRWNSWREKNFPTRHNKHFRCRRLSLFITLGLKVPY